MEVVLTPSSVYYNKTSRDGFSPKTPGLSVKLKKESGQKERRARKVSTIKDTGLFIEREVGSRIVDESLLGWTCDPVSR